jgi:hypothetical protein
LNGSKQWEEHIKTRKHKNAIYRAMKAKAGGEVVGSNKKQKKNKIEKV